MRHIIALAGFLASAALAGAAELPDFSGADVIFLGEQHDNPAHHARQADIVAALQPAAVVYEMLTPAQASRVSPGNLPDEALLEAALGWTDSGWPDFSMYYPIFAANTDAAVFGAAIPRDLARKAMQEGVLSVFGDGGSDYGLTTALPADQQSRREALQAEAHCNALPESLLPTMVDIQRLRDASLARTARQAFEAVGGPVVVITGNGHARQDWGAPALLAMAAPELVIQTFGQGETPTGAPPGGFDHVEITAPVDRGDPCDAFR